MRINSRIKARVEKILPQASFARNVGILSGGTALAQALGVLALPVITRVYTPEDFSVFAVYSALLAMIGVVACLRLEIAIPLPEDDVEAANLLALGLVFTTIISGIVAFFVLVFSLPITQSLGQPALAPYLWLLPVGIWLTGAFACAEYWATRTKKFSEIAKTRFTQIFSSLVVQIAMGVLTTLAPLGLLLGQVMTSGTGVYRLGKRAWADVKTYQNSITRSTLKSTFLMHANFPKYSTFEAFSNNANVQLPLVIIAAKAIGPEAGFALLAMRAAAVPMGLIGSSISQVYFSRASDDYRAGRLPALTKKIIAGLVGSGVGPLMMIGILAPDLMPLVFGPQWARAGELVSWMTPWFILQFISSPISMALHVTGNQRLAMLNQIWGLVLRVGLTAIASIYYKPFIVEIYSLTGIAFYLGYFLIILKVTGVNLIGLLSIIKKPIVIVFFWLIAAFVLKILFV